nr:MAG TPA: hypothetical protein [Caudoviricetes sp.]
MRRFVGTRKIETHGLIAVLFVYGCGKGYLVGLLFAQSEFPHVAEKIRETLCARCGLGVIYPGTTFRGVWHLSESLVIVYKKKGEPSKSRQTPHSANEVTENSP